MPLRHAWRERLSRPSRFTFALYFGLNPLLAPHSLCGDEPLKLRVVCPQNGTAVQKKLNVFLAPFFPSAFFFAYYKNPFLKCTHTFLATKLLELKCGGTFSVVVVVKKRGFNFEGNLFTLWLVFKALYLPRLSKSALK